MKIESMDVAVYTVPTEAPEADGTLQWDATTVVIAEPVANGQRGLGFSYATAACAPLIREVLCPVVIGREALNVSGSWSAMVDSIRNIGRPGVASMAIAAVDIACWDLKAKLLALPLARLLGMSRAEVPIYGSGGFTSASTAELTGQLWSWVSDNGIHRVKMKVGTDRGLQPERDLQRVTAVRRAVGADAELMVDANGAYTAKQAVRLARSFAEEGVTWFEEPVSSDDLAGLRTVRELVDLDVAAGEYGYDSSTSNAWRRPAVSTCCNSTSRAAPASASGCGRRRRPPRTGSRCQATVHAPPPPPGLRCAEPTPPRVLRRPRPRRPVAVRWCRGPEWGASSHPTSRDQAWASSSRGPTPTATGVRRRALLNIFTSETRRHR